MTLEITVGAEVFQFSSYEDWIARAQDKFRYAGLIGRSHEYVCIDTSGRICTCGKNFKTAQYPVAVFLIEPTPTAHSEISDVRESIGQ